MSSLTFAAGHSGGAGGSGHKGALLPILPDGTPIEVALGATAGLSGGTTELGWFGRFSVHP